MLGAVAYGWSEFQTLQDAPDAKANNATYGTYLDFFLAAMKKLEAKHHQRLVHALDVHWYPEARGAKRITENDVSPRTVEARVQAPRSLWDPSYVEKSWIAAKLRGKPIRLIPWLQEKIAARYPGTKLAMTEYNFGAGDHVSGGLAQADALGVFGREGRLPGQLLGRQRRQQPPAELHQGGFSALPELRRPGGRLRRHRGRRRARDLGKASVFAASDSRHPGTLTVLVINKTQHTIFDGKIAIKGGAYAKAKVFAFDATSPKIRALPDADIKDNQLAYRLPPLSATLFVCSGR